MLPCFCGSEAKKIHTNLRNVGNCICRATPNTCIGKAKEGLITTTSSSPLVSIGVSGTRQIINFYGNSVTLKMTKDHVNHNIMTAQDSNV